MLELMKEEGVFSVDLSEDKTIVSFGEECDQWFSVDLNKSGLAELITDLQEIEKEMILLKEDNNG